jgi:multiple sugar transport system ATP-binding protein
MPGRLKRNGAGLLVELGEGVAMRAPDAPGLADGRDITIGVRPEHLAVRPDGVPAEVIVVEPTGMDTQIYCNVAGNEIAAVVRERHDFRPGEVIRLAPTLTYLFDRNDGARLR